MNVFILSQFPYSPLIWMFHSRKLNHRTNKMHECALKLVYNYQELSQEVIMKK